MLYRSNQIFKASIRKEISFFAAVERKRDALATVDKQTALA